MFVQRFIPLALAFGSPLAGLISPVLAQTYPFYPNPARSNAITLSGESLLEVENRTAENDYGLFFPGSAPVPASENPSKSAPPPGLLTINDRYEIIFSSPIQYPEYVNQFRPMAEGDASQSIRVRFPVGDGVTPSN